MTDDEFDLLDELYFLQSYEYLKNKLDWEDQRLLFTLESLLKKGWIKCYSGPEEEIFGTLSWLPKVKNCITWPVSRGF